VANSLDEAEAQLELLRTLTPEEYSKYDYSSQGRQLEDLAGFLGAITSVTAGLDQIILEHKVSTGHLEAEKAAMLKDVLKDHKAAITRQASMIQSLRRGERG